MAQKKNRLLVDNKRSAVLDALLKKLYGIIETQLGHYNQLLKVAKQERQAIIQHDLDGLRKVIEGEEQLINMTRSTERERVEIGGRIADLLNIAPEQLTLTGIIESGAAPVGLNFKTLQQRILLVVEKLERVNSGNSRLLRNSISCIDRVFNSLVEPKQKATIYSHNGVTGAADSSRVLVDKKG